MAQTGAAADPLRWPEPQRAFWQDGPSLLLSQEQRQELLSLDEAGRDRFIQEFLAQDPVPETPVNELRTGIERRQKLAGLEYLSPGDVRAQLLFLNGPPTERLPIDCGTAFKPLEIWMYLGGLDEEGKQRERRFVVYRSQPDLPFQPWEPSDGKAVLYTSEMVYWLQQWEELARGRVKRFDLITCREASKVDRATGIEGLTGSRSRRAAGHRRIYGMRPWTGSGAEGGEKFLDPPGDLGWWAREATKTVLPETPPPLPVDTLLVDYPQLQRQRMVTRGLVTVPVAEVKSVAGAEGEELRLLIEGIVETDGRIFEEFRARYKMPVPKDGDPLALAFERQLRPGQRFLLRLRIKDEGSGREAVLARSIRVPQTPEPSPEWDAKAGDAVAGEPDVVVLQKADSLVLLPPNEEVVFGLWRAEALVTGDRIQKVSFFLDGKLQLSRTKPPFTTEVRLPQVPTEAIVKAEGYDANGRVIASDQVALNRPREAFRLEIVEPAEGAAVSAHATARAEVIIPEGRRVEKVEFSVNDKPAASLAQPPWQTPIEVPDEEIVYLTVTATLDNAQRLEEVRFLRAPENLEQLDVQLVELYTTVVDRSGQLVQGLTEGDFEVLEGGKPQAITKFELVQNLPLTIGIVLDNSGSMESSLVEARQAASDFLRNVIQPRDRCFSMRFSSRPELLVAPTDDVAVVSQSLEGLQAVGGTALHDAIVSSLHYFRATQGQRALVLLSDGDDTASSVSFEDALEYARRSGVAIYPIGLNLPIGVGAPNKLKRLAEATGGRFFNIHKAADLAGVYEQIEAELRSKYLLAFQAESATQDRTFRIVEVRVKKSGMKARTARGYYP
ncbi:MAG TPA: VWA domain-containing protein [Thermoanaerobaculia bacterium]|nr:VWA domain-containing protein [Thermoanaerobaculia bacterium]